MLLSKLSQLLFSEKIRCSVIIVAAGSSQRFGSDKIFAPLMGTPILAYSLMAFEACDYVSEIIVVTAEDKIISVAELCDTFKISKVTKVLCGGATRTESALSGASEVSYKSNLVAVHDGARPLVSSKIIEDVIICAHSNGAALPVIPATDTIKIVENNLIISTPDRAKAFCAQTPQVFLPEILKGALTNALQKDISIFDDASAVEALGFPVCVTNGSPDNIKITTLLDIKLAEHILQRRCESTPPSTNNTEAVEK